MSTPLTFQEAFGIRLRDYDKSAAILREMVADTEHVNMESKEFLWAIRQHSETTKAVSRLKEVWYETRKEKRV